MGHKSFPIHHVADLMAQTKMDGLPPPIEVVAWAAIGLMGSGGVLIATGMLPRLGCFFVLLFLGPATYFQHVLAMQEATDEKTKMVEMIMVLKNVSMAGAALMLFGYECAMPRPVKVAPVSGSKNKKKKNN